MREIKFLQDPPVNLWTEIKIDGYDEPVVVPFTKKELDLLSKAEELYKSLAEEGGIGSGIARELILTYQPPSEDQLRTRSGSFRQINENIDFGKQMLTHEDGGLPYGSAQTFEVIRQLNIIYNSLLNPEE
jgi:hypothetical protein